MCDDCAKRGLTYHLTEKAEFSRRAVLDGFAAGGLASLIGRVSRPAFSETVDDDVVRIGYLPITDATALLVAHAKGYFQDEGLKAEKPTLIRGWAPLVEAFAAGKFNLVHLLKPVALWMRYNNNIPVKVMAWAHTNGSSLVVGGDTNIRSFGDLGGKQIAVPFWYSMHNIVLHYALRQSGLTPVIQSTPPRPGETGLQVMQPPDMPPALAAKKIDGYIVAEPFDAMGELGAGGRILRFTGDIWKNHPCCVVCMPQPPIERRPEWTQKVRNAIVRAEIYVSRNKGEVAELLSRDGAGYLPMTANVVTRAMTLYGAEETYRTSGETHRLEERAHRFPALAVSLGDAFDRAGDERNPSGGRSHIFGQAGLGVCGQGSRQLRLRALCSRSVPRLETRPQRQPR